MVHSAAGRWGVACASVAPGRSQASTVAEVWPRARQRSVGLRWNQDRQRAAGRHPTEPRLVGRRVAHPRRMRGVARRHPVHLADQVAGPMEVPGAAVDRLRRVSLGVRLGARMADRMGVRRVVAEDPRVVRLAVRVAVPMAVRRVVVVVPMGVRLEARRGDHPVVVVAHLRQEACRVLEVRLVAAAAVRPAHQVLGDLPVEGVRPRLAVRLDLQALPAWTTRLAWLHRRRRRSPWRFARTGSSSVPAPARSRPVRPARPASHRSIRGSFRRRHRTSRHRRS